MSTYNNYAQTVNNNVQGDNVVSLRTNMMTREDFLKRILYSGEVTRMAQHLALVIFLVAEGQNQAKLSVRDLHRITGWSRPAIQDHLSELEVFMRVTFRGGSAKALFELEGVIEKALTDAIASGIIAKPKSDLVANEVATVVASQPAANFVASQVATNSVAKEVATSDFVASQPAKIVASQPAANFPAKEKVSPHTPLQKENSLSVSQGISNSKPTENQTDPVEVTQLAIIGPGFRLDVKAIEMAAGLIGMQRDRALAIAEVCARDWAANKKKPEVPMAMVKAALRSDFNQGQIADVRLGKAKASGEKKPKLSRW